MGPAADLAARPCYASTAEDHGIGSLVAFFADEDSTEHGEPLIDAREDGIGQYREQGADQGASCHKVGHEPVDVHRQVPRRVAIVSAHRCGNGRDVPLDAEEHEAHAHEDGTDDEADAEDPGALRGALRDEEAGGHERARSRREEGRAAIDQPEDKDHPWDALVEVPAGPGGVGQLRSL